MMKRESWGDSFVPESKSSRRKESARKREREKERKREKERDRENSKKDQRVWRTFPSIKLEEVGSCEKGGIGEKREGFALAMEEERERRKGVGMKVF